jgi:death-on-curing protein
LADAFSAHERALTLGGLDGIPNPSLVESAIKRPYSGYYREISQKAAALAQSMAGNHGFADGNKRTTLILLHALIRNSGYQLVAAGNEDLDQELENIILAAASNATSIDHLIGWFRPRIRRIKRDQTQNSRIAGQG